MTSIINCLFRDHDGYCSRNRTLIDDEGTPVTSDGYEYKRTGTTEVMGWGGSLDGTCSVWDHVAGAYSVLIPKEAA